MNRINIQRLLHTLLPFLIMTMIQRSLILIFSRAGLTGDAAELCALLPAALAAVLVFRISTYTVNEETENLPLEKKSFLPTLLRLLEACAAMITAMFAVAAILGGEAETGNVTVLRVIAVLLIHPVTEEILFRKLFYGELRQMHPVFGVVAQALMFAIVHDTVGGMVYALASGIILGILYERTGRLTAVIAAHFVINLRSLLATTVLAEHADIIQAADILVIVIGAAAMLAQMLLDGRLFFGYSETDGGGSNADSGK